LLTLFGPAGTGYARAQEDEIVLRGQPDKPLRDKIVQESPKGIKLASRPEAIPATQIADVFYDIPREIRFKSYRTAQEREKAYLTTRPAAERRAALAQALKAYQETRAAVAKVSGYAGAKRHLTFKEAQIRLWQAQDEGDTGKLQLALDALKAFADDKEHRSGWQVGLALTTLARLQIALKDYAEAEKSCQALAEAGASEDVRDDALILAAEVPRFAKKPQEAMARLKKLVDQLPPGSPARTRAQVALAESLAVDKRLNEATALLNRVITEAKDNRVKARAYNALGRCYLNAEPADAQNLHEGRWAFLFVDLIYHQDADEQAEALYHLTNIFQRLGEPERGRECVDILLTDRRFAGADFMRKALREQK
jgi:hypothetical protein